MLYINKPIQELIERGHYDTVYGTKHKWRQMMEDRSACAWPHLSACNAQAGADRWISVDKIAAYLGIKRDTVYRWISERNMPGHKIGRLWKFRKEEIDEWVKSGGARRTKDRKSRVS